MLRITILAVIVAIASIPARAEDQDDEVMQGAWTAVKAELAGMPMPPAFLKSIVLNCTFREL